MNRPTLFFLLCCSVLFNVFFIIGALQWQPGDTGRLSRMQAIDQVVAEIDLNQEQRASFEEMRAGFEAETAIIRQRIESIRSAIAQALAEDEPDLEQIDALVRQKTALQHEHRRAGSERFEAFLTMLTPEQRHALGRRMKSHNPRHAEGRQRMLDRFDLDHDGLLDDEEQQEADDFLETRRRERDQKRDNLHDRFDRDGDGFLSPQEEEQLQEFLENRPRRDGRPRGGPPGPPRNGRGNGGFGPPSPPEGVPDPGTP